MKNPRELLSKAVTAHSKALGVIKKDEVTKEDGDSRNAGGQRASTSGKYNEK